MSIHADTIQPMHQSMDVCTLAAVKMLVKIVSRDDAQHGIQKYLVQQVQNLPLILEMCATGDQGRVVLAVDTATRDTFRDVSISRYPRPQSHAPFTVF